MTVRNSFRFIYLHNIISEAFHCFDVIQNWKKEKNIRQASTLFDVKSLFETLKVELEATVVR